MLFCCLNSLKSRPGTKWKYQLGRKKENATATYHACWTQTSSYEERKGLGKKIEANSLAVFPSREGSTDHVMDIASCKAAGVRTHPVHHFFSFALDIAFIIIILSVRMVIWHFFTTMKLFLLIFFSFSVPGARSLTKQAVT